MNRRERRKQRHSTSKMHSDTPALESNDVGMLRLIAGVLHRLAREIERIISRKNQS